MNRTKLNNIEKRINQLYPANPLYSDFYIEHTFKGGNYSLKMSFTQLEKLVYIDLELLQGMKPKQRKEYLSTYFDFGRWKIKDGEKYRGLTRNETETLLTDYSYSDFNRIDIDYENLTNEQIERISKVTDLKELKEIVKGINEQSEIKRT